MPTIKKKAKAKLKHTKIKKVRTSKFKKGVKKMENLKCIFCGRKISSKAELKRHLIGSACNHKAMTTRPTTVTTIIDRDYDFSPVEAVVMLEVLDGISSHNFDTVIADYREDSSYQGDGGEFGGGGASSSWGDDSSSSDSSSCDSSDSSSYDSSDSSSFDSGSCDCGSSGD